VGNGPFRRICIKYGAEVTVSEMALARSIVDGKQSELALIKRHPDEKCFGIQVAGGYADIMVKCAEIIEAQAQCDFVDINMGCPLDGLHSKGAGSCLMTREKYLEPIVRGMSSILTCPLTIKMRISHDLKGEHDALSLIPKLKTWGVNAMTIHGRTARQRYSKTADWDYIERCAVGAGDIPIVGGGDVMSYEEWNRHLAATNISAIMIGRGALIKPWVFQEIEEKKLWDISSAERFDMIKTFVRYGLDQWGSDAKGVATTRRFLLEWMSFLCRYVPVGLLERTPQQVNWRAPTYVGRDTLETKMGSTNTKDWVEITEMLLGRVPSDYAFVPKHKSSSW